MKAHRTFVPVLALPLLSLLMLSPLLAACGKTEEPSSPSEAPPQTVVLPPATATKAPSPAIASASASAAPATPPPPSGPLAGTVHPALLDPSKANEKAPATFKAKFTTTKGDFVLTVHRDWAPNGADRFYNLVKMGFYDDTRFFRAIEGFMVQFGISGDPAVNKQWGEHGIPDDPVTHPNKPGTVTFAQRGVPGSRTTQIFVNLVDNGRLDGSGFAPFAEVSSGMDIVNGLYKGYGEGAPSGQGPDQGHIQAEGNAYLDAKFPKLDGVKTATIVR